MQKELPHNAVEYNPDIFLATQELKFGRCSKVVETILSKLYFFPAIVLKWYKPVQAYYGNLIDMDERRQFYIDDYAWNHIANPHVYTGLLGLRYESGDQCSIVSIEDAQDFLIRMKHLQQTKTMSESLMNQEVSTEDLYASIELLLSTTHRLGRSVRLPYSEINCQGFVSLYAENLCDLRNQLRRAGAYLPIEEADRDIEMLTAFVKGDSYFQNFPNGELGVALDCHTDNILYTQRGEVILVDSMFPKRSWRIIDELHTIARFAANVAVLGDLDQKEAIYRRYREIYGDFSVGASIVHEIRTVLMQWSRRHLLGDHLLAEKFHIYASTLLAKIK